MQNYTQFTLDDLLLNMSFQQLIDMYVAIGKDCSNYIMKKVVKKKKTDKYGNFTLPGVNVVKSKPQGKVTWKRV
jgi:hypothetical protein